MLVQFRRGMGVPQILLSEYRNHDEPCALDTSYISIVCLLCSAGKYYI